MFDWGVFFIVGFEGIIVYIVCRERSFAFFRFCSESLRDLG